MVTAGLSHGLSLLADLFGGEGKAVAVPQPFWGNYRQAFATRTGSRLLTAPAYVDGRYNPRAIADALAGLPPGEPAVGILNLPSNPGGYSPDREERRATVESLLAEADRRPLVVICDDAYAGLVFEPEIPRESLFWELAGAHPNLAAVKVDGATKEFSFFGGRVGFLTFAVDAGLGGGAGAREQARACWCAPGSARRWRRARWCCSRPCATRGSRGHRSRAAPAGRALPGAEGSARRGRSPAS